MDKYIIMVAGVCNKHTVAYKVTAYTRADAEDKIAQKLLKSRAKVDFAISGVYRLAEKVC